MEVLPLVIRNTALLQAPPFRTLRAGFSISDTVLFGAITTPQASCPFFPGKPRRIFHREGSPRFSRAALARDFACFVGVAIALLALAPTTLGNRTYEGLVNATIFMLSAASYFALRALMAGGNSKVIVTIYALDVIAIVAVMIGTTSRTTVIRQNLIALAAR